MQPLVIMVVLAALDLQLPLSPRLESQLVPLCWVSDLVFSLPTSVSATCIVPCALPSIPTTQKSQLQSVLSQAV
jgi:hypothetical protein